MKPFDRRTFLSAVTAGTVSLAGCPGVQERLPGGSSPKQSKTQGNGYTTVTSELDGLPVVLETTYPSPAIRTVDNLVVIDAFLSDSSLLNIDSSVVDFGKANIYDPDIFLEIENGAITHVFPGNFPRQARIVEDKKQAYGQGINTPWGANQHAVFGITVAPDSGTGAVPLSVTVGGRAKKDGDFKEITTDVTLPVEAQSRGNITAERLAGAAEERARLCRHFGALLADIDSFDDKSREAIREAMFTIGIGGIQMLADEALGSVIGVNDAAGYLWSTYTLHFKSPIDYVLRNGVPENPTEVDGAELAEYGPPFFSELLSNAQGLVEDFNTLVEEYDYDARKAEEAATILFHTIAEAARDEANAWQDGDEARARQLLANQLYMVTGEDQGADRDEIETRFNKFDADDDDVNDENSVTDMTGFSKDAYPDTSTNIVQKLFTIRGLRKSDPRYTRVLSTIHTMQGFMKGEGNRLKDFLKFSTRFGETPTDTNQPPVADAGADQTVTAGDRVILDGSGSNDPEGDSLTYRWAQVSGPTVTLQNADTATAEFTAPSVGNSTTLRFELTVSDGERSDTDTAVIAVEGVTESVQLDGFESGAYDDGDPVTWQVESPGAYVNVQRGTVKNGEYALEMKSGQANENHAKLYHHADGATIRDGDVFSAWMRTDGRVFYRLSARPSGGGPHSIQAGIVTDHDRLKIQTSDQNGETIVKSSFGTPDTGQWYLFEMEMYPSQSELIGRVYDSSQTLIGEQTLATSGATDLEYTTLHVPTPFGSQDTGWFDDVSVGPASATQRTPTETGSESTVTVDGFEDGNIDEWTLVGKNNGSLTAERDNDMKGSWAASLDAHGSGGENRLQAYRNFSGTLSSDMALECWISFTHEDKKIPKIRYENSSSTTNYFQMEFGPVGVIENPRLHVVHEDDVNETDLSASVGSAGSVYKVVFTLNSDSVMCELMNNQGNGLATATVDHPPEFAYDTIDRIVVESQDDTSIDVHFDDVSYPTLNTQ